MTRSRCYAACAAILGLRALYVVLAGALADLRYLRSGLAGVLAFAGAKLLLSKWVHVPPLASVTVIAACIAISVVFSIRVSRRERRSSVPRIVGDNLP